MLVLEHNMKFVQNDVGADALFPVLRHPVQDGIRHHQQAQCFELFAQSQDVIDHYAVVCIHVGSMGEHIQIAGGPPRR